MHKHIFSSLLFAIILAFFLSSCESKVGQEANETKEPANKAYHGARLVQVDSIMIDLIGNFKVYDYQPEADLFLGGDIGSFMITMGSVAKSNQIGHVVFNRKGEILHQFNNANSGPEGHSPGAYDNAFLGPLDIGVMSKKALYQYGIDGSFKEKYPELNTLDLAGYSGQRMIFSSNAKDLSLGLPKGLEEAGRAWDSLYQIVKPLWFYDIESAPSAGGEVAKATMLANHGFPNHPIYAPDSKLNHSPFAPKMALNHNKNELYSIYPEIPVITVYDMETGEKLREIELEPDNFIYETETGRASGGIKGYEELLWLNKGGRMANSRYYDIIQLGEYSLLRYSAALPSSVVKELLTGPVLRKNPDWPRLRRKHYRFYYQLFKDGQKVLPDFELPMLEPKEGQGEMFNIRATRGQIIAGNGLGEIFVFIPNDGEEERDYELIRIFKLELLEE